MIPAYTDRLTRIKIHKKKSIQFKTINNFKVNLDVFRIVKKNILFKKCIKNCIK